jgi:hypothetical protein
LRLASASPLIWAFAKRLKVLAVVDCLFAGIVLGPVAPGFIARVSTAYQASEIGVMLLMRGVGLNFAGQRPRGGSAPRSRVTWSGSALQQFLGSGVPMLALEPGAGRQSGSPISFAARRPLSRRSRPPHPVFGARTTQRRRFG